MKTTVEQEELQLLGDILRTRLKAKVPASQDFQVKCAIKNDLLMILTQHPPGVTVDTEQVFDVLAQTLQSQFNYKTQHIQFFLRVFGDKLPYAKYFLDSPMPTVETEGETESTNQKEKETSLTETIPDSFVSTPEALLLDYSSPDSILHNLSLDQDQSQEIGEESYPFVHIPAKPKKRHLLRSFRPGPIISTTVFIVFLYLSGTFVLHRGCVILECKELQTAKKFKGEYQQQIKSTKTDLELLAIQQKLDKVVADLQKIPQWSSRYQESQELANSFSQESLKINQVLQALRAATSVKKTTLYPAKSWAELRNRQNLLRQAITRLNNIKPESEFYQLVQGNLPRYENSLKTITQQLIREETWLKKIARAKTLREAAIKRQATAKSAADWQQVKYNLGAAINILKTIPQDSFGFQDAGKLLVYYQSEVIVAYENAEKEQLSTMSSQQLLAIINQVKTDLNKTCTSKIKICTFTIENHQINIRLSSEYDSLLKVNNRTMQLHFQSLQNALKVIGQKYQLPVFIYNSQGQ
ncbi:hypothetical protein H6G25_10580 [Dolichospermum sp. FACHB-1091]|uniref:hypothetical protein n=1 Tax=Dolichospermum sp. FACHB-1091 TaxID=2692798 RepID=UPI001680FDD2|nr:hypothetical protein [Dolichospermum sp. FACHB-1091]MBD2443627.1 hypothetical protein [Dolichospermum sp. FACHB-1091]